MAADSVYGFIFEKVFEENYTIFQNRILDLGLSDGAVVFYLVISRMMFGKKASAYPSQEYLSKITGKNVRTIGRYIVELTEVGALEVVHRFLDNHTSTSNLYKIVDLSKLPPKEPEVKGAQTEESMEETEIKLSTLSTGVGLSTGELENPSDKNVYPSTMRVSDSETPEPSKQALDIFVNDRTKMSDKEILNMNPEYELWCGHSRMYEYDKVLYECGIDPDKDAYTLDVMKVVNAEEATPEQFRWSMEQMDIYMAKGKTVKNPIGYLRDKIRQAKKNDGLLNRPNKSTAFRLDKYNK